MTRITPQQLAQKYSDILSEEVNVKTIEILPAGVQASVQYVPLGKELSDTFGKDTGAIIAAAKAGNVQHDATTGKLTVLGPTQQRILESHQYEIRYSGLDEHTQTVEDGIIVELDFTITEDLKKEGVAREISRFLNQMRKDENFNVEARVDARFDPSTPYLADIVLTFHDFLTQEALLKSLTKGLPADHEGQDIALELDEGSIRFVLRA